MQDNPKNKIKVEVWAVALQTFQLTQNMPTKKRTQMHFVQHENMAHS